MTGGMRGSFEDFDFRSKTLRMNPENGFFIHRRVTDKHNVNLELLGGKRWQISWHAI
jgi:hypothetical protein